MEDKSDNTVAYLAIEKKAINDERWIIELDEAEEAGDALALRNLALSKACELGNKLAILRAENERFRALIQHILSTIEAGIADGTPGKTMAYRATIYVEQIQDWKQRAGLEDDKCSP